SEMERLARATPGVNGPANGSDVKLQAASTRERTSGAPLAALHTVLTLSVCKRRDAVRLALNQPARPAGAAFGGLSASAASWAALFMCKLVQKLLYVFGDHDWHKP